MNSDRPFSGYAVYKGLQQPLVFKSFKGRYIYWGLASVLAGFLSAAALTVIFNFLLGFTSLLAVSLSGLVYTNARQRKGLHSKTKSAGIYIVPARFRALKGTR
ncbi:hypothetical protein CLV24_11997 [Pontibacter ummariensis]|uniref:DUF4133 domain-containing protein n=1 Tax=Pontibacter ummariensis TaxID=1610492 RepID=A0A239J0B7_9BACT|nr:DUF4133 domain-containing protein [Pontibacter ummariensis]PRY09046.1 hypothetical protein CLV24_11997 [Pontibacter ummariensis]SNS99082.1 hypothetical protein SAMN06296052_11997 [Pontibacter ummariensis]